MEWLVNFIQGLASSVVNFFEGFFKQNPGFMEFLNKVLGPFFIQYLDLKGYKNVNLIVETIEQIYLFIKDLEDIDLNAEDISSKVKEFTGLDIPAKYIQVLGNSSNYGDTKYQIAYMLSEQALKGLGLDTNNPAFKRTLNLSIEMAVNAMVNTGVFGKPINFK